MSFIHFMLLKLIKTTQKWLIFWYLSDVLIKISAYKKIEICPSFTLFLKIFRNQPRMFAIFEFIR